MKRILAWLKDEWYLAVTPRAVIAGIIIGTSPIWFFRLVRYIVIWLSSIS